jgi:ABC-type uncharacterized transport system permease subunit
MVQLRSRWTLACRTGHGPHAKWGACNAAPSLAMGGNRNQSAGDFLIAVWMTVELLSTAGRRARGRSMWKLAVSRLIAALARFLSVASAALAVIRVTLGIAAIGIAALLAMRAQ